MRLALGKYLLKEPLEGPVGGSSEVKLDKRERKPAPVSSLKISTAGAGVAREFDLRMHFTSICGGVCL